jgi:uncharacterized protein (DUF2147 family)
MRTLVLSGTILLAAMASAAAQTADPLGEWLVEDGSARIKVVSCPAAATNQPPTLWGVIWAETKPGADSHNPDPSMRNRPMLGVPILINMKQTEANKWEGKIYDANGGSLYDSHISVTRNDMLAVRGCMGVIFCGGQDWKRVTGTNTPPLPQQATPVPQTKGGPMAGATGGAMAPQAKGGAMAPQTTAPQTKGMAKGGATAAPAADPICSNVASLVPRI